jgi:hypothetical protein
MHTNGSSSVVITQLILCGMSSTLLAYFVSPLPQTISTIIVTDLHPIIITIFPIRVYHSYSKLYPVNIVHTCRNLFNFMRVYQIMFLAILDIPC